MKNFINTITAISCAFPSAVLAAPAAEPATSNTIASRVSHTPKMSCYNMGQDFAGLASTADLAASVAKGCGYLADTRGYNNINYSVNQESLWCTNVIGGHGSLNMRMKYRGDSKGNTGPFNPATETIKGGLAQYCWVAMQWALTSCKNGGIFYNHALGSDQTNSILHYWDVTLDPNTAKCASRENGRV